METVNVAVVWPEATVTVEGTEAEALLVESETTVPPEAAAPFNVTVPVEVPPPCTAVGLSVTEATATGLTVKVAT